MPAKSKTQQRLMGMVYAYKNGELDMENMSDSMKEKIKKMAKGMTKKEAEDFASTKHKKLPEKKAEKKSVKKEDQLLDDIALLKEDMRKVVHGILNESIIPYTPESLREDYDPDEDEDPDKDYNPRENYDSDDDPDPDDPSEEVKLEYIADRIREGYLGGHDPNWKISYEIFEDGFEMGDADYNHVADLVEQGVHSGELCLTNEDHEDCSGWWEIELFDN